ncbi:hypothetical protein HDF16_005484 [Granulicella aggregans]|uniref:Uncharacterized protein n=1 Tax=Granulicella aggregans TaxID=474949 RepID=A0A7W7ZJ84_9BACT|nr:hypothetical protein [Granulicella aggregans]
MPLAEELWYIPHFRSTTAGERIVLENALGVREVSPNQARLLGLLPSLSSWQELMSAIRAATYPPLSQTSCTAFLEMIRDTRLLISLSTIEKILPSRDRPSSADTIIIFTRDRPHALRNALDSAQRLVRSDANTRQIVIFDSSGTSAVSSHNRDIASSSGNKAISYVGLKELAAYRDRLWAAGASATAIEGLWASVRVNFSAGSARNLALLRHQGQRLLLVDDDVDCRFMTHSSTRPERLSFVKDGSDHYIEFPWQPDAWAASALTPDRDVLQDTFDLLGRSIAELTRNWRGERVLNQPARDMIMSESGRVRQVRAVTFGICGDSGCFTGDWLGLRSREYITPTVCKSRDPKINLYLSNRNIVDIARSLELPEHSPFMCYSVALDNRDGELPPFPPTHRNEDGVFGQMLRNAWGSCVAVSPFGVYHFPKPKDTEYGSGADLRVSDILLHLVTTACSPSGRDDLDGLMETVASAISASNNRQGVISIAREIYQSRIERCDSLLAIATQWHAPNETVAYLTRLRQILVQNLSEASSPFYKIHFLDAVEEDAHAYLTRYQDTLLTWSDVRSAAQNLIS